MEIYLEKCLCMVHFVLLFIWVKANKLLIPTLHLQWVFMEGLVQHILNFWKYKTCSRLCKNFHKFMCWIVCVHKHMQQKNRFGSWSKYNNSRTWKLKHGNHKACNNNNPTRKVLLGFLERPTIVLLAIYNPQNPPKNFISDFTKKEK
jgi:hypothetical protein